MNKYINKFFSNQTYPIIICIFFSLFILGCTKTAKENFNIGFEYYSREEDSKAIDYFKKAVELDSTFFDAYLYLGKSYYYNFDSDLCIETLLKAKKIKAHNEVFEFLGFAYEDIDENYRAIEIYEEGLKYYPNDYFICYNLACCYHDIKKLDRSLNLLKELTKNYADSADIYYMIGKNLFLKDEIVSSLENLKMAITKSPNRDYLYHNLSLCYLRMNFLDSAIINASKAFNLNNDEENLLLLTSLYLAKNDEDSTYFYFERLKDMITEDYRETMEE